MRNHISVFVCVIFLLTSCGMQDIVVLDPPKALSQDSNDGDFHFLHDQGGSNTEYFKGYEVYYRIYDSETEAQREKTVINGYNESEPTNVITRLVSLGYLRMTGNFFDAEPPLIPIDESDVANRLQIDLSFSRVKFDQNPEILLGGEMVGTLHRGVQSDSGNLGKSLLEISILDTSMDIKRLGLNSRSFFLEAWALSYGISYTDFNRKYSQAAFLGILSIPEK